MIRHINGGYGDPYDWVVLLERKHPLSTVAYLHGLCGQGITRGSHVMLRRFLGREMGFTKVRALRNGRWREYEVT